MLFWTILYRMIVPLITAAAGSGFDPCTSYETIDEPRRSTKFVPSHNDPFLCDRLIKPRWARFRGAEMPFNTCIQPYHCGTHVPIWLKGTVPSASDGIVEVTACADTTPGNSNCCEYTHPIRVKNCGHFMVYDLLPTIGCSIAYCAGMLTPCMGAKYSVTGYEPCQDAYPILTQYPTLGMPEIIPGDFKFTCHIPYPSQNVDADFTVTWLTDDQPIPSFQPIHIHGASGIRNSEVTGKQLAGQLGKTLSCSVKTFFSDNRTGIISPAMKSNNYWMGVKYSAANLKLDPTVGRQTLQLISTLPVVCNGPGPCSLDFHLHTNNGGVVADKCKIQLTPPDWNLAIHNAKETVDLTPTAVLTTSQTTLTATFNTSNVDSIWWNSNYKVPYVMISTTGGAGRHCSMTGDPHIRTFDMGKRYNMYLLGQFTAVRTKTLKQKFRVDIRTKKCGDAACICGVVAREGNDVVGLDICHGKYAKFLKEKSIFTNQTVVHHDSSGRNYVFKFPSSAFVKAQVVKHANILNVFIQVPGFFKEQTEGLCGYFDYHPDNDLTDMFAKVNSFRSQPDHFSSSWRIPTGESLFEKVVPEPVQQTMTSQSCDCSKADLAAACPGAIAPGPPIQMKTNASSTASAWGIKRCICPCEVLCPGCQPVSSVLPTALPSQSTTIPPSNTGINLPKTTQSHQGITTPQAAHQGATTLPALVAYTFTQVSATPPTPTHRPFITRSNASRFCDDVINAYKPARDCIRHTFHLNVTDIKNMCIEDLMLTGDHQMAVSALCTLVEDCGLELLTNVGQDQIANVSPLVYVCPGACSGSGQCVNGVCICNSNYGGSDCSIDLTISPKINQIIGGSLCDINVEECHYPTMVGENMSPGNTTCILRDLEFRDKYTVMSLMSSQVTSIFGSTNHVNCPLPNSASVPLALTGYAIQVNSNGRDSQEQFYTIYDSRCFHCHNATHCKQKINTCWIENQCYSPGDINGVGEFCNPAYERTSWYKLPPSVVPALSTTPMPPMTTQLPSTSSSNSLSTAPIGGLTIPRLDIWTKTYKGCKCIKAPTRSDCACCEAGGVQCPGGDMCVKEGELQTCGTKKPSDTYGEDYWTATFSGCGCLFDFARADCACCQNQGCPCSAANRNQCVDCLHRDRCGLKSWIFGPKFSN